METSTYRNRCEAIEKSKYVKELNFLLYDEDNGSDEIKTSESTDDNSIDFTDAQDKTQEQTNSIEKPIIQTEKMVSDVKKERK